MKRSLGIVALAAVALVACADGPPVPPPEEGPREVQEYTIEQFMETTSFGGASFSPDGSKILLSHDGSGVFNVYSIPVEGGPMTALTRSESQAMFGVSYFPDDERFLYTADEGGNELNHLYVQTPDGTVADLTPGEGHQAQFAGWADDDASFFVASNERDPRFFDLYEYEIADGYPRTLIYENTAGYFPGPVSEDGRYLTFVQPITTDNNELFLYDRETGSLVDVTPHEGDVASSPNGFSPDGGALLYTTNEGGEFQRLMRYDIASGAKDVVVEADWDVSFGSYSDNGRYLVVGINNDAQTELRIYDTASMEPLTLPGVGAANITGAGFSDDESTMVFYASGSRFPANLFVQRMDGSEPVQLTSSLNPDIASADLVDGEVERFASYDGLEIPGILYRPHAASAENPVPAMVWVHGGPGGQSRIGYSSLIQYLVNHGYAVYAINNRGSSGYGKTFYAADNQRHGEADLGDVVASKDMLAALDWVDGDRIGIIGGSYGGYMVLAALAFEPEEFDVGVDIFGVANWLRTLESIPPWWEAQKDALYAEMGDPTTDRERLERISPLFHAENIVKPLIVLQGANDPRVLQVESDEMVEAVRANGVVVDYRVFPDEGHGFRNKDNQITAWKAILGFLDTHLKGIASGPIAE